MIRLGHALWLALPVAAGIGLFHLKYEVQALEERLNTLRQQIRHDQEAIHVLRAEWSYLNEPRRLTDLVRRHLELAPVTAGQLAAIDDLPPRLVIDRGMEATPSRAQQGPGGQPPGAPLTGAGLVPVSGQAAIHGMEGTR
jgi:hypothetical protein